MLLTAPRSFASALFAAISLLSLVAPSAGQTACNGHVDFCSRSYSNVSIIGAHNSYGVGAGNIAANQNYSVETQLNDGIRMLQVQGHINGADLHLCHTSCGLLDGGTFTAYLTTVKTWLDANPNEVVTLLLVNSAGILPSVWAASYVAAGLDTLSYTPPSVPITYEAWPTLQELITSGKRVVSFLAQNADVSTAPFLIDQFTNIWETPFGETSPSFPCTVDRVTGTSTGKMYLINHILNVNSGLGFTMPNTAALAQTNAVTGVGSLSAQAELCFSEQGYLPTFTLVDYYDVGNGSVFEYAAQLNGVTYVPSAIGTSTASSGTPSSTGRTTSTTLDGAATRAGISRAAIALVGMVGLGVGAGAMVL